MSRKTSTFLFYIIHCLIASIITTLVIYLTLYLHIDSWYLYFIITKNFCFFCILNSFVMLFTHKMLKLDKTKRYYLKLSLNYLAVNLCSYLTFRFVVLVFWIVANIG